MKRTFGLLLGLLLWVPIAQARAQINCPSGFSSSGSCGVANIGAGGQPFQILGTQSGSSPSLTGGRVLLISPGANHAALSLMYQQGQVNVQSFTSTFTFVPNGQNIAWFVENSTNNPWGFNGKNFSAGAGCEADFYQAFSQPNPPDHVFALDLDSWSNSTVGGMFTNSTAQIYTSNPYVQCSCSPSIGGMCTQLYDKLSTAPVSLNSPSGTPYTTTGDTYSATLTYDGTNLTLSLYDVTVSGPTYSHTWNNVDIPGSVGGNTAWVGMGSATGSGNFPTTPLYISSMTYAQGQVKPPTPTATATATATPTATATATQTATPTATPTCTPLSGTWPITSGTMSIQNGQLNIQVPMPTP